MKVEGVNAIKVHYMQIRKYHSDTPHSMQLIYTNKIIFQKELLQKRSLKFSKEKRHTDSLHSYYVAFLLNYGKYIVKSQQGST
jgi:hypothetical protein